MNVSPFKSFQEFSEATGPIYSMPEATGVLVVISALLFVFFIVKSYLIKH